MVCILSRFLPIGKIGAFGTYFFSSLVFAEQASALMVETGVGAIARTVIGLLTVLGLIFICAWIVRCLGIRPALRRRGMIKFIDSMTLTQREKVVVIEVRDTWLVLGVTQGNVRLLYQCPAASEHGE